MCQLSVSLHLMLHGFSKKKFVVGLHVWPTYHYGLLPFICLYVQCFFLHKYCCQACTYTHKHHWIVRQQLFSISPICASKDWEHPELLLADSDDVHNRFRCSLSCWLFVHIYWKMSEGQHGVVGIPTPSIVPRLILPHSLMPAISK